MSYPIERTWFFNFTLTEYEKEHLITRLDLLCGDSTCNSCSVLKKMLQHIIDLEDEQRREIPEW